MDALTEAARRIIDEVGAKHTGDSHIDVPFFQSGGWERLDEGIIATTRYVFASNEEAVVKVAQTDQMRHYNEKEYYNWQEAQDETLFAPVVEHGPQFEWIKQRRCRRVKRSDESIKRAYKQKLAASPYNVEDLHLDNLGVLPSNNEIVCFDYPNISQQ
jgi:hypothetical protein